MTTEALKSLSAKDLAELAKNRGVRGWHSMRKDQLVKALVRLARAQANRRASSAPKATNVSAQRSRTPATNGKSAAKKPVSSPTVLRKLSEVRTKQDRLKNLSWRSQGKPGAPTRDRLVVMVRDSFWLHAFWEITRQGVERAQAAMAHDWHTAKPILRLYRVTSDGTTNSAETSIRDIEIHGGVNNWYIDVQDPPCSYRLDIGYRSSSGKFHVVARSNAVSTPKADSRDAIDENWTDVAENYDKIYALSGGYSQEGNGSPELQELFEERLRRPMGSPMMTSFGSGVDALLPRRKEFTFEVDAELIVFGKTEPDAHVTLLGQPVRVREDGSFTVRFAMPNARQVIPAVASSANGLEQRTVVLAIERNTKVMEPLVRDSSD